MAELVFTNVKQYFAGYDISGDLNSAVLNLNANLQDKTTFGTGTMRRLAGLTDSEVNLAGFFNASSDSTGPDDVIFGTVGSTEEVMTLVPQGTGLGNVAYFTKNNVASYQPEGTVGEMFAFTFNAVSNTKTVRGFVMEEGSLSSDLTPTVRTLGVRGSTQTLYAALHVIGVSSSDAGATLHIETDNTTDFSGTPSTAITIAVSDTDEGVGRWESTGSSTGDNNYRVSLSFTTTDDSITGIISLGLF